MSKNFILTDEGLQVEAKKKDLSPMVDKFKQYLLDNIELINEVEVIEITPEVKVKQSEAGITGHTHLFICKFALGQHILSLNANKKTTRGWKKNIEYVNKSYEKFLMDKIESFK